MMETCKTCGGLGRVPPDLQEVALTTQEARLVGGIVANWIGEMGSIFDRLEMRNAENALRHKLRLKEQK
jgi:hypothetical protein